MRYVVYIILSIIWVILLIDKFDGETVALIIGFFWFGFLIGEYEGRNRQGTSDIKITTKENLQKVVIDAL